MRLVKRLALGLVLLAGACTLLVVLGMVIPTPGAYQPPAGAVRDKRILVLSNSIHTDIAVPLDEHSLGALPFLSGTGLPLDHPDARWLLIGWGGRAFYLETPSLADMKPGPTFKALTIDTSVMHVDVLGEVDQANPAVVAVDLTSAGYDGMLAAIAASFVRTGGLAQPIEGYALTGADRFYEAEGSFNAILFGCNAWTARMLRTAGISSGFWTPLPQTLELSLNLFNQLQATAP